MRQLFLPQKMLVTAALVSHLPFRVLLSPMLVAAAAQ